MTQPAKAIKRLVYFADPMCSWCYGFSPVIAAIAERFEDRMPLQLVMGGLRAGNTAAMRPQDKDTIRDAWTRVGAATGQPFEHIEADMQRRRYLSAEDAVAYGVVDEIVRR